MLGAWFSISGGSQKLALGSKHGGDVGYLGLTFSNSAGLIEYDYLYFLQSLDCFAALDQDTVLCAHAAAHHQGGRCGETKRTWAGDDQYGYSRHYGQRDWVKVRVNPGHKVRG